MRTLIAVAVVGVLAVGAVGFFGCDARSQVALDKVTDTIDAMLGKLDVSKKQIEMNITALTKGIDGMKTAKAKIRAQLALIDRKSAPVKEQMQQTKVAMSKLSEYVKAGTSVSIGGKEFDQEQLKSMASDAVRKYKAQEAQVKSLESTKPTLDASLANIQGKIELYEQKLVTLRDSMEKVEAKLVALKAMQETSAALGDADGSLASNVDALERDLASLEGEVDAGLLREDERYNASETQKKIDTVDTFIESVNAGGTDPVSEIDAILGTGGENK